LLFNSKRLVLKVSGHDCINLRRLIGVALAEP
jgi:hypothetical protein